MKYITFLNGHKSIDESLYLKVALYSESRLAARATLNRVLVQANLEEGEMEDTGIIFTFVDERELEEGEEPNHIIYGHIPDINGVYPETPSWQHSY